MESLVWFRSDLRLEDNPALRNAFENSKKVHALYIFSTSSSIFPIDQRKENITFLEISLHTHSFFTNNPSI